MDFSSLSAEVTRIQGIVPSAVALINGFQSRLDQAIAEAVAANDNADLSALTGFADSLRTETDALASAVAAGSPAQPESPAEPTPTA